MNQLYQRGFHVNDQKVVDEVLSEWFTADTLDNILTQWENKTQKKVEIEQISLNILCYNVQGWGSRSLEVIDIVYKIEASICVFTEVGELWNTSQIPHFNIFHQHGTNKSGGVCIAIGKHLKGSRIDLNIENTIIVDVDGLSETVKIIAIYWPAGQTRVLGELESYITKNTIITSDFNASVKEWGSTSAYKRGRILKEWVEKNNLCYIPSLSNSSKRSNRNIDLTFTNLGGTKEVTLKMGTSDHWSIMITCENLVFDKNSIFPHVHWKAYEAILTLLQEFCFSGRSVIVPTKYGDVLGYATDLSRIFYGIPFAQPPLGPLRWNLPAPISRWAPATINATEMPPACPQPACDIHDILCPKTTSEDCLYLNIFTPLQNNSSLLPVMIFIPGGNFQFLDASLVIYEADRFVNTTNVVCIFIQYRLGVLGFLATGTGPNDFKGNYGILDQRLAIAWIKSNIDAFGGDPNQITLFGQSAGAQSTALHYVTSDMQSFFQAAIIQSSPMAVPFRTYAEYITPTVLLAEKLNCTVGDLECFRRASYQDIVTAQTAVNSMVTSMKALIFFEPWLPVIDNTIVHGQLLDLVTNVSFPLKPLITGTLTEEALGFIHDIWSTPVSPKIYVEVGIVIFGTKFLKIVERYPPEGSGDQRPLLARLATQWIFACPTRVFARKTATYSYVFGYPLQTNGTFNSSGCEGHTCHGDELVFLFEAFWTNLTTNTDRYISTTLATYWTNYAKSKDTNQPVQIPLVWPKVTNQSEQYLYFQDPLQIKENYLKDDCDFWDEIGY
ncbi:unnamed protein product [Rotaria socialis]|uniref:Carboxylesterase n=1 Tax=Rotaria socialis TaxID=392032 RepID=A0A820UK25_9BILA|nr:unnamed protein product [Rotaria socialis]CAF4484717.1 unnamed protein product [Rotaria socialis]